MGVHACSVTSVMSNSQDPMDYSPPGSSVHGFLQARILEWVAMPSCRESFPPRDWTHVWILYLWATGEASYICICMSIYIYICHAYIDIYICHAYRHAYIYIYIYTFVYIYAHTQTYVHIWWGLSPIPVLLCSFLKPLPPSITLWNNI